MICFAEAHTGERMPFMQPKQQLAALTLLVVAMETTPGLSSQLKSFDGAYKGNLECEPMTAGSGVFRTLLSIIIRDGSVMAMFDAEEHIGPMQAAGTVDPGGAFRFGVTVYTQQYTIRANYSGTLSAIGGTLSGTQVSANGSTRTCKGTVSQVELPKR